MLPPEATGSGDGQSQAAAPAPRTFADAAANGETQKVHGVVIQPGETTFGQNGPKRWEEEELRKSADSLSGTLFTVDPEFADDHNIEPAIETEHGDGVPVGTVSRAAFDDQRGVVYDADLHDQRVAELLSTGELEISVEAGNGVEEETDDGFAVLRDFDFLGIRAVPSGAAKSNYTAPGSASENPGIAALSESDVRRTLDEQEIGGDAALAAAIHEPTYQSAPENPDGEWSRPALDDFNTDDLSQISTNFIASRSGNFPPANYGDLRFPVVAPDGTLRIDALRAAKSRIPQAGWLTDSEKARMTRIVDRLAERAFDRDWSDDGSAAASADPPADRNDDPEEASSGGSDAEAEAGDGDGGGNGSSDDQDDETDTTTNMSESEQPDDPGADPAEQDETTDTDPGTEAETETETDPETETETDPDPDGGDDETDLGSPEDEIDPQDAEDAIESGADLDGKAIEDAETIANLREKASLADELREERDRLAEENDELLDELDQYRDAVETTEDIYVDRLAAETVFNRDYWTGRPLPELQDALEMAMDSADDDTETDDVDDPDADPDVDDEEPASAVEPDGPQGSNGESAGTAALRQSIAGSQSAPTPQTSDPSPSDAGNDGGSAALSSEISDLQERKELAAEKGKDRMVEYYDEQIEKKRGQT